MNNSGKVFGPLLQNVNIFGGISLTVLAAKFFPNSSRQEFPSNTTIAQSFLVWPKNESKDK
jgi:hypothetical protein